MGSFRSKEDDVSKISTSIFVTNFPKSFTAKDLFHSCKVYGHVVDSFIPLKRSREGKRFSFVRFINVFNVKRASANGNPKSGMPEHVKKDGGNNRNGAFTPRKGVGSMENGKSFVDVLSGKNRSEYMESESSTAIVLDDDCFDDLTIRYMGELWIILEFESVKSKDLFRDNTGAVSWFSVLRQASNDFMPEGRIVWVEVEGIPFKVWSGNTFNRIAAKWGELLDFDDQEDLYFHSKRLCIYTKLRSNIFENFKIVYRGKVCWIGAKEVPMGSEFLDDSDEKTNVNPIVSMSVDAPQDSRDKCMLWDYLTHVSSQWDGEVPLGGSAFTWSHKSATKMSKIDRFLISDGMRRMGFSTNRNSTKAEITRLIGELAKLDEVIDNGKTDRGQRPNQMVRLERDENVQFFHGMINKKRSQQNIRGVMIDGKWIEEPSRVKKQFFQHFRDRFDEPKDDRVRIDMCFPRSLSNEQKDDLERMVSMEEVKRAVWDCGTDKSPGPDGFSFGFYRHFWPTIDNECNLRYMRRRTNLGLDRSILNLWFLHWCKTKKKQALFFKVDFEKAYDTVRWDFLDDVLHKFGFGNKWRLWIQSCLRSSRGSIFVNGSPMEELQFFKGLKQGDPLSPFLFILIMESLHLSFQRVVDAGFVKIIMSIKKDSGSNSVEDVKVKQAASKLGFEKVTSCLSRWKMKTLSIGGRLTLLKSVLGSMPIFHMSIFKVPSSVLQRLESIRSRFFKGHDLGSNKASLDSSFRRKARGGIEQVQYEELSDMVNSISLTPKNDRYVWSLSNSGDFSVASFRKVIDENRYPGGRSRTRCLVEVVPCKGECGLLEDQDGCTSYET
ncbi:RNA-directed DNA polymerase, eukaryota [Tanacetum coccineum]